MADSQTNVNVLQINCESSSSFEKKTTVRKYRRSEKNTKRRYRRKRSKVKYYKSLKRVRYNKNTEDLCGAVSVFNITDMELDSGSSSCLSSLPADVVEWQKQEQLAYWKSRAISLEVENRMLHQHLRNLYTTQIEQYRFQEVEPKSIDLECKKSSSKVVEKVEANFPNVPKREDKEAIYGDKAARILGMETAVQLNFDRHIDQSNPPFWPHIPINI